MGKVLSSKCSKHIWSRRRMIQTFWVTGNFCSYIKCPTWILSKIGGSWFYHNAVMSHLSLIGFSLRPHLTKKAFHTLGIKSALGTSNWLLCLAYKMEMKMPRVKFFCASRTKNVARAILHDVYLLSHSHSRFFTLSSSDYYGLRL